MSTADISPYLIEPHITKEQYSQLRDACCADWSEAARNDVKAVEDVIFRRHDEALRFVIPWVLDHIDLQGRTIIEIGAGSGSSSLAFSHYCSRVKAYDIDSNSSLGFFRRKELFDGQNKLAFKLCKPGNLLDIALEDKKPSDVILFYAVAEHLTIEERLDYLSRVWKALAPGDFLIVVETPNRFAYFDGHTTRAPFLHLLPDELFLRYLKHTKQAAVNQDLAIRFGDALIEMATQDPIQVSLTRARLGLGASFHEFEIAFGCNLSELVIADGFGQPIINWFPVSLDDRLLLSYWDSLNHDIPVGFARSVLSFIFYKPKNDDERRRIAAGNRERSMEIKKLHSLTGELAAQSQILEERWAAMQSMEAMIRDRDEAIAAQGRMLEERWAAMQSMEAVIFAQARRVDWLGSIARFSTKTGRWLRNIFKR